MSEDSENLKVALGRRLAVALMIGSGAFLVMKAPLAATRAAFAFVAIVSILVAVQRRRRRHRPWYEPVILTNAVVLSGLLALAGVKGVPAALWFAALGFPTWLIALDRSRGPAPERLSWLLLVGLAAAFGGWAIASLHGPLAGAWLAGGFFAAGALARRYREAGLRHPWWASAAVAAWWGLLLLGVISAAPGGGSLLSKQPGLYVAATFVTLSVAAFVVARILLEAFRRSNFAG